MGIVKYSGPIASFHCPTNAEIRSLKVHFSPKQLGEGTPSPENVREIEGWDGVTVQHCGKNIGYITKYSASSVSTPTGYGQLTNPYGTTINTTAYTYPKGELIITQSKYPNSTVYSYQNGYIWINCNYLNFGTYYDISLKISNIINNPLNVSLNSLRLIPPQGSQYTPSSVSNNIVLFKKVFLGHHATELQKQGFDLRICGLSCTLSDVMITPSGLNDQIFEPYRGDIISITFPTTGKNLFDAASVIRFDNMKYEDNIFSNTAADTRATPNYTVQQYKYGDGSGYISAAGTLYTSTIGRISFLFTIDSSECKYIRIKHNGTTRDQAITISWPYGLGTYTISFDVLSADPTTVNGLQIKDIQIEVGNTATEYVPYNSNNTVYGGWVDLISGEVCETHSLKTFNGSEQWLWSSSSNGIPYITIDSMKSGTWYSDVSAICDTAIKVNISGSGALQCLIGYNNNRIYFYNATSVISGVTDLNSFTNWLSTNNISITYPLEEPITYSLAPTQMQTFLSHNNIWSNADYVEVEYDLHETQSILARKQFIVANQPHVETLAAAPLQSFKTDMAAPVKECKVHFGPVQDLNGYSKPWVGGAGKNLFNINAPEQDPSDTTAINTTLRIFEPNTYCVGTSYSNYFYPTKINSYSVSNNTLAVNSDTGYAVGFAVKATAETTYFISASITNDGRIGVAYYDSTGQWISGELNKQNKSFTTPANTDIVVLCFNSPSNQTEVSYSNIQLEVGSAATSYEPYENICPISGRTGLEAYRTGKNLFNAYNWQTDVQDIIIQDSNSLTVSTVAYIENHNSYDISSTKGTTRTLSFKTKTNSLSHENATVNLAVLSDNGTTVLAGRALNLVEKDYETEYIITIPPEGNTLKFRNWGWNGSLTLSDIQLELGSTATEYEPYNGETIPVTFPAFINLLDTVAKTTNKTLSSTGEEISESGMTVTPFMKVSEGSEYTLTFTSTEGARTRRIYGYDTSKEPVESLASASWVNVDSVGTLQATIPSGIEYIRVCYKTADTNISLIGPESSVFYGGYVDLINGELVQEYGIIDLGTLPWHTAFKYGEGLFMCYPPAFSARAAINWIGFSDKYPCYNKTYAYLNNVTRGIARAYVEQTGTGIVIKDTSITLDDLETMKAGLSGVNLVYQLLNPIHYSLTPTQLKTLRGANNVWSNANGNVELKFWKH